MKRHFTVKPDQPKGMALAIFQQDRTERDLSIDFRSKLRDRPFRSPSRATGHFASWKPVASRSPFELGWGPDPARNDWSNRSTSLEQKTYNCSFWFFLGQRKSVADVVQIGSRTEKMFPSHLSVNDLGVFAVVMVFGLIVVLLFMFDFVSTPD